MFQGGRTAWTKIQRWASLSKKKKPGKGFLVRLSSPLPALWQKTPTFPQVSYPLGISCYFYLQPQVQTAKLQDPQKTRVGFPQSVTASLPSVPLDLLTLIFALDVLFLSCKNMSLLIQNIWYSFWESLNIFKWSKDSRFLKNNTKSEGAFARVQDLSNVTTFYSLQLRRYHYICVKKQM